MIVLRGGGEEEEDTKGNKSNNETIQLPQQQRSVSSFTKTSRLSSSTIAKDDNNVNNTNNVRLIPTIRISLQPKQKTKRDKKKFGKQKQREILIERRALSKFDLCTELDCSLRDLRNIISDPHGTSTTVKNKNPIFIASSDNGDVEDLVSTPTSPFILSPSSSSSSSSSASFAPCFLVRETYIILHMDHIRVVIQSNYRVLIFLSEDNDNSTNNNSNNNNSKESLLLQELMHNLIQQIYYIFQVDGGIQVLPSSSNASDPFLDPYRSCLSHDNNSTMDDNSLYANNRIQNQTIDESNININPTTPIFTNTKTTTATYTQTSGSTGTTASQFQLAIFDVLLSHISSQKSSQADVLTKDSNDLLFRMLPPSLFKTSSKATFPSRFKKKPKIKRENFLERQRKLGQLLLLKNKVDKLVSNCDDLSSSIAELVKNEEDMSLIVSLNQYKKHYRKRDMLLLKNNNKNNNCPSENYQNQNENNEKLMNIEFLLEDYLLQFLSIRQYLQTIQSYILNTEEVLNIELDLIRNRIMQYEVLLNIFGLVFGIAAAVTGMFGMNLLSHLEFHKDMFWRVTGCLFCLMVVFSWVMVKKLVDDNIW